MSEPPVMIKNRPLVERLRAATGFDWRDQCEAADEIERLTKLAGPSGKSLGLLEEINDLLLEENNQFRTVLERVASHFDEERSLGDAAREVLKGKHRGL